MGKSFINYPRGAVIQVEDTVNPGYIYIVRSGSIVGRNQKYSKKNEFVRKYGVGDTFGLVSALTKQPHIDTLIAETDVETIRLTIDAFFEYLKHNKETLFKFFSHNADLLRKFIEIISPNKLVRARKESVDKLYYHAHTYMRMGKPEWACYALEKYLRYFLTTKKESPKIKDAEEMLKSINPRYKLPNHCEVPGRANIFLQEGEIIFLENEPHDYFYFVIKGSVKLVRIIGDSELILAISCKDEIFGEMAILNHKVRSASAIANEECILMRLTSEDLFNGKDDFVVNELFSSFARRIWYATQRYYMLQSSDVLFKLYAQVWLLYQEWKMKNRDAEDVDKIEFRITENDLKKMVGIQSVNSEPFNEFLRDQNFTFKGNLLKVRSIHALESKYGVLKNRNSHLNLKGSKQQEAKK